MPRLQQVRTRKDRPLCPKRKGFTGAKVSRAKRPLAGVVLQPLLSFRVRHVGIHLRVRLFATPEEVWEAYLRAPGVAERYTPDTAAKSFFRVVRSAKSQFSGEIVLLRTKKLMEYVPHEVTHAILHYWETPVVTDADDEEEYAYAVGRLCAKIFAKVKDYAN